MDAGKTVMVFGLHDTLIIEHTWPKPGTAYVSTADPADPAATNCQGCPDAESSAMSQDITLCDLSGHP
ncbi:hypothetical protein ACWKWN_20420 [Microbacterium trichothecenolyticum]